MTLLDVNSELANIINDSMVTIFIWKPSKGWPVDFVSENVRQFGYSPEDFLSGKLKYEDIIHPVDIERVCREVTEHSETDVDNFIQEYRILTASGENRCIEGRTIIRRDKDNNIKHYEGIILDISKRKLSEPIIDCRNQVLESLASGATLDEILMLLVRSTEKIVPGAISFVMLLDREKKHLVHAISPQLPDFYKKTIEGIPIGEGIGSCSTAAYTRKMVVVEDIMKHPHWEYLRELAAQAGLRAICCDPIISSDNEVFGTFGMYFREPHKPTKEELDIIKANSNLAAIAINNKIILDRALESEKKLKIILNNVNDQIYISELNGKAIAVNQAVVDTLGYTKDEMLRSYPCDIVSSQDVEHASKLMEEVEKDGRAIYETEAIHKDGRKIPLEVNARFIIYDGKKTILSVARDISERKRAERKRCLEEKRL